MPAAQLNEAEGVAEKNKLAPFVTAQDEYSLLNRAIEKELTGAIAAHHMGLLPYFPLASGLLTGKYEHGKEIPANTRFGRMKPLGDRYMTEQNWRIVGELTKFCGARGHTLLELAFSWLVAHPFLSSVIAGATRPEQVEQNVKAAGWKLSKDEMAEVDRITNKAA
jgi:aryl-alcohol dehydrogenase-like predicted oxidoreductase